MKLSNHIIAVDYSVQFIRKKNEWLVFSIKIQRNVFNFYILIYIVTNSYYHLLICVSNLQEVYTNRNNKYSAD